MRVPVMVLAVLLATGAGAVAQTTPARTPPSTTASDAKLDGYLKRWETEMRKVQTLSALLSRIDKDKVFSTTRKFNGWAQYMKSGSGTTAMNKAVLELKADGKTEVAEKLVCTGTYLYQFMPAQKEIRAYELPRPKPGQVADDNFLGFLFGMKADDARKKYNLKLAKEDKWYIYVDITPRNQADKVDFSRARLVLNRDTFLPRQLWFEHANGNEVTWDIPRLQSGVVLDARAFDAPRPPKDWKLVPVRISATPPPRVIRQSKQSTTPPTPR
jgi:TIGR03009 family protein